MNFGWLRRSFRLLHPRNLQMSEYVTVKIPQGTLRGKKVTSASNGVTYYSFQGIPYAKPPVGPLRFKPPEDPEPWTGTKDATIEGSVSLQFNMITQKIVGDENCLFLNVYTQQVGTSSPKAVMVWIHGGAYFLGSGNTNVYGPDYLIAEDIVLVTLNYRIGALGFLYLDGADMTGNNGLRDQVMALKWVKNNIAHFGGDPGNVTISGESAGGISVHFLMLSPLASGLFHRAIAQSGTAMLGNCYAPHDVTSQRTVRLAKSMGCTATAPQEVANYLRAVPSEELALHQMQALSKELSVVLDAPEPSVVCKDFVARWREVLYTNLAHATLDRTRTHKLITNEGDMKRPTSMPFFPSEEIGPDAFLPASPTKLLREGRFAKVPFIAGVTSAEGKLALIAFFPLIKLSEIDKEFDIVLPQNLVWKFDPEKSKEVAKLLKTSYFGDKALGEETISQYIDLLSDLMFVYPLHEVVQMQNKWSQHPTYVYVFDHISPDGVELFPIAKNDHPGAAHGAELSYLFKNFMTEKQSLGVVDSQVSTKLVKLWAQFVKTGNPSSEEANVTWTPTTNEKHSYLKINGGFNMCSDMYNKERITFLEELYIKFGIHERSD